MSCEKLNLEPCYVEHKRDAKGSAVATEKKSDRASDLASELAAAAYGGISIDECTVISR